MKTFKMIVTFSFVLIFNASLLQARFIYYPDTGKISSDLFTNAQGESSFLRLLANGWEHLKLSTNCELILKLHAGESEETKIEACRKYLIQVGTPVALVLLAELEDDTVYYPDGTVYAESYCLIAD